MQAIRRTAAGLTAAVVLGCSAEPRDEPARTTSSQAVTISGSYAYEYTFDGYPAYAMSDSSENPGTGDVYSDDGFNTSRTNPGDWFLTDGQFGFQCVELARRYFWGRYRVQLPRGDASGMCDNYGPDVMIVTSPAPGDLMVWVPNTCSVSKAGHVAVINSVSGDRINVTQQNVVAKYSASSSCAKCYLRAKSNTAPTCTKAVGDVCGNSTGYFINGDANTLYTCNGAGAPTASKVCPAGCQINPSGYVDECRTVPVGTGGAAATGGAVATGGASAVSSGGSNSVNTTLAAAGHASADTSGGARSFTGGAATVFSGGAGAALTSAGASAHAGMLTGGTASPQSATTNATTNHAGTSSRATTATSGGSGSEQQVIVMESGGCSITPSLATRSGSHMVLVASILSLVGNRKRRRNPWYSKRGDNPSSPIGDAR